MSEDTAESLRARTVCYPESAKNMESLGNAQKLCVEGKMEGGGRKTGDGEWMETKKGRRVGGRWKEEREKSQRIEEGKKETDTYLSTCRRCLFYSCQAKWKMFTWGLGRQRDQRGARIFSLAPGCCL